MQRRQTFINDRMHPVSRNGAVGLSGAMKEKKTGIYKEEGWEAEVEILSDTSTEATLEYSFKVIKTLRESHVFTSPEDGAVIDVMQRTDSGAWGGMWELELH